MRVIIGTEPGVIVGYIFAMAAISIMGLRLYMRRYRGQPFNLSDYLTMFCGPCLVYFMNAMLLCSAWGSTPAYYTPSMTPNQKQHLQTGSQIAFAGLHIYTAYLWAQKAIVLCFIERLLGLLPWPYIWIRICWAILLLTFIAVAILYSTVCLPVRLFWQVEPAPDTCVRSLYPIISFLVMNCITDLLIFVLPLYWLFKVRQPLRRRVQILALFSIGILLIAVTVIRLANYRSIIDPTVQVILNPIEELFAAIVANVPMLWSLRRGREPAASPVVMRAVGKRGPRVLGGIVVSETMDVEDCGLEDRTQSTNTTEQSWGDGSDRYLVQNTHSK